KSRSPPAKSGVPHLPRQHGKEKAAHAKVCCTGNHANGQTPTVTPSLTNSVRVVQRAQFFLHSHLANCYKGRPKRRNTSHGRNASDSDVSSGVLPRDKGLRGASDCTRVITARPRRYYPFRIAC